jgi:hypothetical protein
MGHKPNNAGLFDYLFGAQRIDGGTLRKLCGGGMHLRRRACLLPMARKVPSRSGKGQRRYGSITSRNIFCGGKNFCCDARRTGTRALNMRWSMAAAWVNPRGDIRPASLSNKSLADMLRSVLPKPVLLGETREV